MAAEEITILRTHAPELKVEGELIVHAEVPRDCPTACGRWHNVAVYRCTGHTWLAQIQFGTLCLYEQPHEDVEVVDSPADVELVLALYEPTEYVNRRW